MLAIMVFVLFVSIFSGPDLKLESVTTEDSGQFTPRPSTTFTFNKEVDESMVFSVATSPTFDLEVITSGNNIVVVPREDLFDGVTYRITISPNSRSDPKEVLVHSFQTPVYTERLRFLRSLPKNFGRYEVARIGERSIYVRVNNAPAERYREEILKLLADHGVTESFYRIDIDGSPSRSDPSYPDQEIPH